MSWAWTSLNVFSRLGQKPGIGGEARRVRGEKVANALLLNRAWERENALVPAPATFGRDVLPTLAGLSARELAAATGFSRQYAAAILRGKRVPHPRWWARLGSLVTRGAGTSGRTSDGQGKPAG